MKHLIKMSAMTAAMTLSTTAQADIWNDIGNFFNDVAEVFQVAEDASAIGFAPSQSAPFSAPSNPSPGVGEFSVVSFNIKGFPTRLDGIDDNKVRQLVNEYMENKGYDIIAIQENWVRNNALAGALKDVRRVNDQTFYTPEFPYISDHYQGGNLSYGDGLSTVSKFPFVARQYHEEYRDCDGYYWQLFEDSSKSPDCETEKGFTFTKIHINKDFVVHFYNTHMDTSGGSVKQSQYNQLRDHIKNHSAGKAVIVTGDFNDWIDNNQWNDGVSKGSKFASELGLYWACGNVQQTNRTNRCSGVDHIAYRGSSDFFMYPYLEKEIHQSISDHNPLATYFRYIDINNYSTFKKLSQNKPAKQSSTRSFYQVTGEAKYAVDGLTQTNIYHYWGALTDWEDNPWWQVDLGANKQTSLVKVFHRSDQDADKMTDFYVMISDTDMGNRTLADLMADNRVSKKYYVGNGELQEAFIDTSGAVGRYVRIHSNIKHNSLQLAEVEVYGKEITLENVQFTELPGNGVVEQASIGSDGTIWATNGNNDIFIYSNNGWHHIGGKLKHVSTGEWHHVWGVNSSNNIFYWDHHYGWRGVGGTLKNISVGNDGTVWGIGVNSDIFYYSNGWHRVSGGLEQISVANAQNICGVNATNQVHCYSNGWHYDSSIKLKQISVDIYGNKAGIGLDDKLYVNTGSGWVANTNAGTQFKYVELGKAMPDGQLQMVAVDHQGRIFKAH